MSLLVKLSKRNLYYWINKQFNVVDYDRRKLIGPDLSCAEWILRNGGSIKWKKGEITDYNELAEVKNFHVLEVDASDTTIMIEGFPHFKNCKYIEKLVLHKCYYINDEALKELYILRDSLKYLTVSSCKSVTDVGLIELKVLKNLNSLTLRDLQGVKNLNESVRNLKQYLNQSRITIS